MITNAQLAKGYEQVRLTGTNTLLDAARTERWNKAHAKVTTRSRGDIPGCRKPDPDNHMATDNFGRPWLYAPPSTIDAWLASIRENVLATRRQRNACEICGEMECDHGKQRRRA